MEIAKCTTRGQMVQTSGTAGYHKPGSHVSFQRIFATDALQNCLTLPQLTRVAVTRVAVSCLHYFRLKVCKNIRTHPIVAGVCGGVATLAMA